MKRESNTPSDFQRLNRRLNIIIAVSVFLLLVSVVIYAVQISENSTGSTNNSLGSTNKCTICGKAATQKFQGYGYCTKHYKDAIVWAMDNVNSK